MRKVAMRGLFARKLRLALTVLAVVLGTTLIAGTYVFTDSINNAFDTIFTVSNRGTDAAITPHKTIDTSNNGGTPPTVSARVLEQVRQNPKVADAEGSVFDVATILGKNGKRIGKGGAPNFISSVAEVPRFQGFTVKEGRKPQNADEATIDAATADKEGWKLGDKVCAVATSQRKCYTLVGTTQIAGLSSFGGAAVLDLVLPEAQRMLGKGTGFDEIEVAGKPGVTPQQLKTELQRTLGPTVDVRTGKEQAAKESKDIRDNLGFLKTFLLAFAFIALFVGAFLIFNTFSITVAQRMREFALLRTLGASRRQIWRAVVSEGLLLGFVGGVVGFALGIGTAALLRALFKAFGADLPSKGMVIEGRTVIITVLVGVIVSLVASISPALRAMRVPPVEALREGAVPIQHGHRRRMAIFAGVLLALGIGLMCVGLFGSLSSDSAAISFMGGGAALTFLAVALLSPRLVRPLASVIGRPIERMTGITGQLARENSVRQPGRTAVTAAALMIGVALVTFASIFAAGAKATINNAIDSNLKSAFVVQNTDGFSPFSPQVLRTVDRVDGVSSVSGVRFSEAKVKGTGGNQSVSSIDPRTFLGLYKLDMKEGGDAAVNNLGPAQVLVKKSYADANDTKVGDTLQMTTPIGKHIAQKVTGIVDDKGGLLADLTVTNAIAQTQFGEPKDAFGLVGTDPGANQAAVKQQIKTLLEQRFPEAEVLTNKEFKDNIAGQVNQLLGLIYALLALAIIVSLFGIVNTLVLSISERTRELGMLRAIGTSRKQVKRVIRWEAVITALIGGVLGVIMGVVLAVLFTRPLDDFTLSIPVPSLIIVLVLAGLAGVGAAVLPARRAAKLDVLEALAYE
ncbi:MAG TPA: FtsX-like permease family protein [Solirubrobacteraceae bacterium]